MNIIVCYIGHIMSPSHCSQLAMNQNDIYIVYQDMGLDMYEYYWHELNTEINNYNWTRFSLGWATSTFSLTASDIDSNEQTVMASLMIELAKFIPVKLNLQGCIQVFWISYVVYFWITQITQTLKMASHECHGLFENPLTDFLIILITLRVESLQPASSGRDQTSNWVVLCRGWTDAWLRDWVVWWEDQLSPPVWEFLFSPVERLRERLNS